MFGLRAARRSFTAAKRDLSSNDPKVRADAASDLAHHGEEHHAAVVDLLATAIEDEDARVRSASALAFADLNASEAVPALRKAARDSQSIVRQMALAALGELGGEQGLPEVKKGLCDRAAEVRFQAVIAYPRICTDTEASTVALLKATRDDDDLVCHIALRMAEELGHSEEIVDPRLVERAVSLLAHDSARVRLASAVILGRCGRSEGRDILIDAAKGDFRTGELDDEAEAIDLCGELQLSEAINGLADRAFQRRLFHRDPLTWQARVALARLGHPRATAWIERELSAWTRERRTLAVAAAGKAKLSSAKTTLEKMRNNPTLADPDAVEDALSKLEGSND